ncbi:relaxase/mobilization nuclease domain-containing protein [Bacteroides fragilis]|uniref:conjugal transfer protein MobB n=1 Tax=Bacteroides fragilis TaxID=817 RepID=UPI00202F61C0|nr:conjugal transfer protein MobB [Bacteroides fragilis]MCM0204859.1 relaxase/mobilization nuclease domain-containing protein [Bacteroides fragilis]
MVAKISTGNSLYGALAYNQNKVDEDHAKVLATNLILQPEDGNFRLQDCMDGFKNWLPSHYRTEKPVIHISLNPHPDDVLTDEQLVAIGEEYMQKLGYGGQPYMIFKHEDIDRRHIHIVSLRVNSNGKKINDSNEFRRSKEITEQLEQKYGLHPAEGQTKGEDWQLTPVDISKGNLKRQLVNVIKPLLKMYRFQSVGEFRALLSLYNIALEEVKGEVNGRPYHGIVYSALDKNGEKTGIPVKSSTLGKMTGITALEKQMKQAGTLIKEKKLKERTLRNVSTAMRTTVSEAEFRKILQQEGIDVVLRRNDTGRIYGVTFIDHHSRVVLNGSRLGKDYSANVFNERFPFIEEEQPRSILDRLLHPKSSVPAFDDAPDTKEYSPESGGLLSLLTPEPEQPEREPLPPKKRKKKRHRYGRQD